MRVHEFWALLDGNTCWPLAAHNGLVSKDQTAAGKHQLFV